MILEIRPKDKPRLIDLVQEAGIDVSDWENFQGGKEKAASNPKYCYEWSFVQPGKVVVLNLWYDLMEESEDIITRRINMRQLASTLPAPENMRASRMDDAIQTAIKDKLPIRAVVSLRKNPSESTSNVTARLLDPRTWSVVDYDEHSGECMLMRDAESSAYNVFSGNWTRDELRASVEAYLDMNRKTQLGEDLNKKDYYRDLSKRYGRSEKSFEYRMQNISYVLSLQGRDWLTGLKPARNVGANVAAQIEEILAGIENRSPSPVVKFEVQVQAERGKKNLEKPSGALQPKASTRTSTQYEREPRVVAWVLNEAKGLCECCKNPAPFLSADGTPFLEVHHVRQLADKGPDIVENAVALCPNCHREIHHGANSKKLVEQLYTTVTRLVRPETLIFSTSSNTSRP